MAGPKAFHCPNCGGNIILRAAGLAVSAVCGSCGSIIDVRDPVAGENLAIIAKAASKATITPLIPLGSRGKLYGITWEVIGFMRRSDDSGLFTWDEYLLFNPYQGFRWLTESDGHWSFVRMIHEKPGVGDGVTLTFQGNEHRIFERGGAKVTYVIGEFYWRVRVGERVAVEDYISPPWILSLEVSGTEQTWSLGCYIEPEDVRKAFHLKEDPPERLGIGACQPVRSTLILQPLLRHWGFFAVLLVVIQFLVMMSIHPKRVFEKDYTYSSQDPEKTKITPSFELTNWRRNAEIVFGSNVDNSWLAVEGSLVNETTGEEWEFDQGSRYHGYDSDGSWSEGSAVSRYLISYVPSGKYHLNFQVSGPDAPGGVRPSPMPSPSTSIQAMENEIIRSIVPENPRQSPRWYSLAVETGVSMWGNIILCLILISIWPCLVWLHSRRQEVSRWSKSDFSPYASASGFGGSG